MSDSSSEDANAGPVAWLRVDTPYPGYADAVVADLTRIARTPSGRALLEQMRASGRSVLIEKPAIADPPHASVRPQDLRAATVLGTPTGDEDESGRPVLGTGEGSDSIVIYDPRQWPSPIDHGSPSSDAMLFILLRQALVQLRGAADPARYRVGETAADETADVERYGRERDGA